MKKINSALNFETSIKKSIPHFPCCRIPMICKVVHGISCSLYMCPTWTVLFLKNVTNKKKHLFAKFIRIRKFQWFCHSIALCWIILYSESLYFDAVRFSGLLLQLCYLKKQWHAYSQDVDFVVSKSRLKYARILSSYYHEVQT